MGKVGAVKSWGVGLVRTCPKSLPPPKRSTQVATRTTVDLHRRPNTDRRVTASDNTHMHPEEAGKRLNKHLNKHL